MNPLEIFRCLRCYKGPLLSENHVLKCLCCGQIFPYNYGIFDSLIAPSPDVKRELMGIARENMSDTACWAQMKIRFVDHVDTYAEKIKRARINHLPYYIQTVANFHGAYDLVRKSSLDKVLEIGAAHDFYFLKEFKKLGATCFALNIHFDLEKDKTDWPIKVLGDMNHQPFMANSFDSIIISATSHHSPTPELLFREIARILKVNGQVMLINDPLKGVIKHWSTGEINDRDPLINENEYPIWYYNRLFKDNHLIPEHFFSAYYDELLQKKEIYQNTRFVHIAKMLSTFWQIGVVRQFCIKHLLFWAQAIFGFPLNVILTKQ